MSLLTAEDGNPTASQWANATMKQLRKGDKFFTPFTQFKAVFDTQGVTLDVRLREINNLILN
jgi:hypothetical protein